jgi:hypothetical protein
MSGQPEEWSGIEGITVDESTAGISSVLQLVSSTSATSINQGNLPRFYTLIPNAQENKEPEKEEPTFNETLNSVIKRHRKTLDALA